MNIEVVKIRIIALDEEMSICFISSFHDLNITNLSITEHNLEVIGFLKEFNKLPFFRKLKRRYKELVAPFSELLQQNNWDFNQYPNPFALALYNY